MELVVVGASLAGLRVAEAARAAGFAGDLTLVGAEAHLPYNRPPLSKEALAGGVDPATLEFRRRPAVDDARWLLGVPATAADLGARTVTLADGSHLPYDVLAVTTGVHPRRLSVPGSAEVRRGRHVVRTIADAADLRADLVPDARVVIVGAGFVGCEVAATAVGLGCRVTVVAPEAVPLQRAVGDLVGAAVQRRHEKHGVEFRLGRVSAALEPDDSGHVAAVLLDDDTRLPADVVVEALGCLPAVEWLRGNDLDLTDGVRTDNLLRALRADGTPHPDIVAAGDVARFPNPRYDDVARRVEHWSMPTDSGRRAGAVAAALLAGAPLPTAGFAPLPSFWSDQYETRLQSFGSLGLADEVRPVQGDPDADPEAPFVVEYLRGGVRVGVLGVDAMPALLPLRAELLAAGAHLS